MKSQGPTRGVIGRGRRVGRCDLEEQEPNGLAPAELDVLLSGVTGELGRDPEQPGPKAVRLSPAPASLERGGPEHVEELIGQGRHLPEQSVAVQVVHCRSAGSELVSTPVKKWTVVDFWT